MRREGLSYGSCSVPGRPIFGVGLCEVRGGSFGEKMEVGDIGC